MLTVIFCKFNTNKKLIIAGIERNMYRYYIWPIATNIAQLLHTSSLYLPDISFSIRQR